MCEKSILELRATNSTFK